MSTLTCSPRVWRAMANSVGLLPMESTTAAILGDGIGALLPCGLVLSLRERGAAEGEGAEHGGGDEGSAALHGE